MHFKKATVYGSGLIGCGWAVCFLRGGLDVTVYDVDDDKLRDARERITSLLDYFVQPDIGVMTEAQKADCLSRLCFTCDVRTAVEDAEFIQEAGPEKLTVKQAMLAAIEDFNATAIIASSTSSMLVTDIAANAKHPERVIAGHPFLPVQIMPLVEIAKGDKTDPAVVEKAREFYLWVGKEPVALEKECKGFIANSIQNAVYTQALRLVSEGVCSVADVDRAVTYGPGLRWGLLGPYLVMELAGGKGGIDKRMEKFDNTDGKIAVEAVCAGTRAEMAARAPGQGRTHEELERYRDRGLIEFLKFHGKF